jgi:hypothetical protein
MPRGHTRTVIGRISQMTVVRSQTSRGPRDRLVSVRQSPQSTPRHKKAKRSAPVSGSATTSNTNITSLMTDEPLEHHYLNFIADPDPPSSKVTYYNYHIYYANIMLRRLKITLKNGCRKRPCISKHYYPLKCRIL